MKTMVIGVFYPATMQDVQASIQARFSSEESRAQWFADRKVEKPASVLLAVNVVAELLQIKHVEAVYNVKAGCTMCPCSPGFDLIASPSSDEEVRRLEGFQTSHRRKNDRYKVYEQPGFIHVDCRSVRVFEIQK